MALRALLECHATMPTIGWTLRQEALPIGWGLRVTQWRASIVDVAGRLTRKVEAHAVAQLGGAGGSITPTVFWGFAGLSRVMAPIYHLF